VAHDEGARKNPARPSVPERVAAAGGLRPGVSRSVAGATAVPEAHVYGVASFFHLLADPDHPLRVCQGLSCRLAGAEGLLERARARGLPATGCSCLAACDRPVAVLRERATLSGVTPAELEALGDWRELRAGAGLGFEDATTIGHSPEDPDRRVFRLAEPAAFEGRAFGRALELGPAEVIARISASGLQGRGGAAFPAGVKWRSVAAQADPTRYVVLNADEGEPGTFKDRELLARRPDLVVEGLAIAAATIGARDVYCYLRGEFDRPWTALAAALAECDRRGLFPGIEFHLHAGQGAYICGEETALLEAIEGKRGMPRLKPPFPTEKGLWNRPTLMHNVETIACVPAIVERGAEWFGGLGRTGPGTKLYCLSGHVASPGVYEMPLGVSLEELAAAAGGYRGRLKAFSPGGASSGFLPASESGRALDFKALAEVGSMLGSAGVVVLDDTVDMAWAVRQQMLFFEEESCGQCAPCRIGTRFQREALDRFLDARSGRDRAAASAALAPLEDAAWQMVEGSICGLGQTAQLPLASARRWFPEEFPS
jgi:NADH:ubiquinone oxidoreductase subunit F (NADH-binding)